MVNRRSILKIGVTTVAGALVNMPGLAKNAARASLAFQQAVFDERFEECRAFDAKLRGAGVLTSAIRGDVARLWYGDLRVQLRKKRVPIAGLTERMALFCLEELARDVDIRVIFRMDHIIDRIGRLHLETPEAPLLFAPTRQGPDHSGFGRDTATFLTGLKISEIRDVAAPKRTGPFSPRDTTVLVSWVIA